MKFRIFAVFVLSVLVFNLGGSTFADSKAKKGGSELVSLLPASEGVVTLDARRFFNDAMPKLLSGNQPMLAHVTAEIEKFQSKTGIDIRQFESTAAGVTTKKVGERKYDIEPVVIARGQTSSAALISAAKSKAKYTEERVGERTIYIFSEAVTVGTPAPSKFPGVTAVAVIDSTTIAFGSRARVRETLEARTKVDQELIGFLGQNPAAVASFASRVPAGLKSFVPMDNDELGKNIDSIQFIYGNADVAGELATVHMTARTLQNAQAKSLHETLEGLQMLGKAFLGSAKGADKQAYARMIGNAKFTVRANEVTLDLQVPQSDIDILVGSLKK
ncbi:MAG TPA: hypothetical protein VMZ26_08055 [Pyrinomonadaceae bacterium]|nr:hypothetical protein [Pyrinomonadaceae bacterium]